MLESYIPIMLVLSFALIFAVVMINLSSLLGPSKPDKEKLSTYESGMEPIGTARERFSVKYYMVAVSFILFDLEVVFLYPWAISFINFPKAEMVYSLIVALIFIFILFVGLIYEYKKGVLKWD
ncbi:MAG: NADH-quinone oxidoreductase subunit A [Ignavibacteriae bacterium]|jgi:NADH-quinone oxidoreductase subunit A|nr:NADH-quinone oxidoreductase subunit A [Ignavibacteriota bacterium]